MRRQPDGRPCCLYRHYDRAWRLLYVGISLSHPNRLRRHRETSAWFDRICTITIEHFPSREAASIAEAHAIATEWPMFNSLRTGGDLRLRTIGLPDHQWAMVNAAAKGSGLSAAEVARRVFDLEAVEALLAKMARKSANS